jgi:hypothetical protein
VRLAALLAPHVVLLAAGCVLTALVWSHGYREAHTPRRGRTRAHSTATGSADDNRTALAREDHA